MFKRIVLAALVALVISVPAALATPPTGTADQSAAGPSAGDLFVRISNAHNQQAAQTFTPGVSGSLTAATVSLMSDGLFSFGGTNNVYVDVTAVDGSGNPDASSVLATSNPVPDVDLQDFTQSEFTFTFPTPATLTAGTTYALVVREEGLDHMHLYVAEATGTYAGGSAFGGFSNSFSDRGASMIFTTYMLSDAAEAKQAARMGYCSAGGTFLNLESGQPDTDSRYTGATPALYLDGLGISCDVPAGYAATGTTVGYGGAGSTGDYPFYKKA